MPSHRLVHVADAIEEIGHSVLLRLFTCAAVDFGDSSGEKCTILALVLVIYDALNLCGPLNPIMSWLL